MSKVYAALTYTLNYTLIVLISGIRPLLGPANCKFKVGCTPYAIAQLKEHNLLTAGWNITKRLALCSPFSRYQEYDI